MTYPGALRRIALAGALALLALTPGSLVSGEAKADGPAVGQDYFEIDQFYDELAPFGEWVSHPRHGYVWLPRAVAPDWRPYTVGNWVSTEEYGWYWDSPEPFAWAVYHYGRWGFEPDYGWYWVPGDTWGPAWVQWRYGDEYVGWAPETPTPGGYAYGGPARFAPPPPQDSWVFVEPRYLTSPAVRTYAVPRASFSIVFSRATYVNRPRYRNGYLYNYGMPRDHWQRVTRRHIEPRRVHRGHQRARPKGWNRNARDLYAYAPGVKKGARPRKPPKKVAHKPARPQAKKHSKEAKARAAQRNRAAGFPPRPLGPRGVMNPNYRGPGASRGPAIGNYKAFEGRTPPQSKLKASNKGKPKSAKPTAAKSKSAKSKSASAKARTQRNRAMSLAPPTGRGRPGTMSPNYRGPGARGHNPMASPKAQGSRKPPQVRRTPPKPKATKSQVSKPKDSKSKGSGSRASKPKAGKPQAKAGRADGHKSGKREASKPKSSRSEASKPKSSKPNASRAKTRANKPKTAYAKPQSSRGKPKAMQRRPAKPQSVKSQSAHAKPKAANTKSGRGGGNKSGKRGAGHGSDRAKACKANPKRAGCGRRG